MSVTPMGIIEARNQLGTLVSRAVHGHHPTYIQRSKDEQAVLLSVDDYRRLLWSNVTPDDRELALDQETRWRLGHTNDDDVVITGDTEQELWENLSNAMGVQP